MKDHYCPESGCLYCMVNELYGKIEQLKADNLTLAEMNIILEKKCKRYENHIIELLEKDRKGKK